MTRRTLSRSRWNRWDELPLPRDAPWPRVDVVVPHYEDPESLPEVLEGLRAQEYPPELFRVIVADDGSEAPPVAPDDVTIVRQEHRGFGLARARNLGARAGDGEVVVFLDSDMVPTPALVAAHAEWYRRTPWAATIGFRRHVPGDRPPAHVEAHMIRTDDLRSGHDDLFLAVSGGNLGVSRTLFEHVGGFSDRFDTWGGEDIELAYRLFNAGAYLVPVRSALAHHLGPGTSSLTQARDRMAAQGPLLAELIPHRAFGGTPTVAVVGADRFPDLACHSPVQVDAPLDADQLADVDRALARAYGTFALAYLVDPEGRWLGRAVTTRAAALTGGDLSQVASRYGRRVVEVNGRAPSQGGGRQHAGLRDAALWTIDHTPRAALDPVARLCTDGLCLLRRARTPGRGSA